MTLTAPTQSIAGDDRDTLRDWLVLGALFLVATGGLYLHDLKRGPGLPRDGSSLVVGRDFLNFWMYGHAAVTPDPGRWYDVNSYQRMLAELLGQDYPGQNWSYPPSVMLVSMPFAKLPYLGALACWTGLGLVIFITTVAKCFGDRRVVIAALVSPAAIFCVISGQSSLLTSAAIIGAFAFLDRRPIIAGVLIGCLTLKPQLGLLFPLMLIASSRWRTFTAAAVTSISIAALTMVIFGADVWVDFVEKALPTQNLVMADPNGIATPFYPTVFMNLRGFGASYALAIGIQGVFACAAACAVWWAFRNRRSADPLVLMALFLSCSIAATPYLLAYDTLTLAVSAIALVAAGGLDTRGRIGAKLIFWLPLIQMILGGAHIPGAALIAPAFALGLFVKLRSDETASHPRSALSFAQ